MNAEKIGNFIAKERQKLNLTQKELANKLNVTSQAISKWERGKGLPDIELLKELSNIFNVNINDILEGKSKPSNKKISIIIFSILLLLSLTFIYFLETNKNNSTFIFQKIASDNNLFTIKGIVAYDKNKKSIYISEITYASSDEPLYQSIECLLSEKMANIEKKISSLGKLTKKDNLSSLSDLLKDLEFNIDNYDCSCTNLDCNNLFLTINALNSNNEVITYNIPLDIANNCTK